MAPMHLLLNQIHILCFCTVPIALAAPPSTEWKKRKERKIIQLEYGFSLMYIHHQRGQLMCDTHFQPLLFIFTSQQHNQKRFLFFSF